MSWCQGFSEPGAGSDLASLQTRAVRRRRRFVVNGQKIWTSGAHRPDYCILLARTDPEAPKHRGISYFLMDMKSPGITITPLTNMLNSAALQPDVPRQRAHPASNLVGELNRGWYVATTTLDFERSGIQRIVFAETLLDDLVASERSRTCRRPDRRAAGAAQAGRAADRVRGRADPGVPRGLDAGAGARAELRGFDRQALLDRAAIALRGCGAGHARAGPAYSRGHRSGRRSAGAFELLPGGGVVHDRGGYVEVQRNIIAQRGLGMPRD